MAMKDTNWFHESIKYVGTAEVSFRLKASEGTVNKALQGKFHFVEETSGPRITVFPSEDQLPMMWNAIEKQFDTIKVVVDGGRFEINNPSWEGDQHVLVDANDLDDENDESGSPLTAWPFGADYAYLDTALMLSGEPAFYWVLPLINFLAAPTKKPVQLKLHPLRLSKTAPVHMFKMDGEAGFIEMLPDFDRRLELLKEGEIGPLITAIMVGPVADRNISYDAVSEWFPLGLFPLLEFAGGCEIAAPWIELRDQRGNLLRRIHTRIGHTEHLVCGYAPLNTSTRDLGDLITAALASPHLNDTAVTVALRHAQQATAQEHYYVEDVLLHVFRAFEALVGHFKFSGTDYLCELPDDVSAQVTAYLTQAEDGIRAIEVEGRLKNNLSSVASRVRQAGKKETGQLGASIVELLKANGLVDHEVADKHYAKFSPSVPNARSGDKPPSFSRAVATYRGASFHEGALDFGNKHEEQDAKRFTAFLIDLLTRVLLKILGFSGSYRPFRSYSMNEGASTKPVDWVKPSTKPSDLGFKT